MIFVDTSAWFASAIPSDTNHTVAEKWRRANKEPLLTTDYIVDETLTLLKARGHPQRALALGILFFQSSVTTIYHVSEDDVRQAWDVFRRYSDKEWSFTDCLSKVVMERLGITVAFAFDHHFQQFGSIRVVP